MSAVKKKKNFLSTRLVLAVKKDESDDAEMKLTFFFFATPHSLQDLSSLTRDRTQAITVKSS